MCNPDVSIIIPVYNVEKYLKRCLDSVFNQTFKNFEIVIINDKSTDDSERIIKDFIKLGFKIKYESNEKNLGLGPSRNKGIEISRGKYILFLDSDDYIEKESLELLFDRAKKEDLDILEGLFHKIKGNKKHIISQNFEFNKIYKGQEYCLKYNKFSFVVWNRLWRRNFLIDNDIKFKKQLYEDLIFVLNALRVAKRVSIIDYKFYNYCIRENSIMTSKVNEERLDSGYKLLKNIEYQYIDSKNEIFNSFVEKTFFLIFARYSEMLNLSNENKSVVKKYKTKYVKLRNKYMTRVLFAKKIPVYKRILLFMLPFIHPKLLGLYSSYRLKVKL